MGSWVTGRWSPNTTVRERSQRIAPISYQAYVPDHIRELNLMFPASLVQEMSRAEGALSELEHTVASTGFPTLRQTAMLEALGSGRLSGLVTFPRRLAEVLTGHNQRDLIAQRVASIVTATESSLASAQASRISSESLERMSALVLGSETARVSVRSRQIWAGTSRTPRAAEFVPPPPSRLDDLMDDLCAFLARDDVPPLVQAAIAHAQYETICPFPDANGRAGRCLVQTVLRRHGLTADAVPPISAVLAINRQTYFERVAAYREGQVIEFCAAFTSAMHKATSQAIGLATQCESLLSKWRKEIGRVRSGSAAMRLLAILFDQPVLDAKQVERALHVSDEAARLGLITLEKAGGLRRIGASSRGRLWVAEDALDLLDRWEYELETA